MATTIYSVNAGKTKDDVTAGVGSATTKDVEVTIDNAKVTSKDVAIRALEAIRDAIIEGKWPGLT